MLTVLASYATSLPRFVTTRARTARDCRARAHAPTCRCARAPPGYKATSVLQVRRWSPPRSYRDRQPHRHGRCRNVAASARSPESVLLRRLCCPATPPSTPDDHHRRLTPPESSVANQVDDPCYIRGGRASARRRPRSTNWSYP